MRHLGTSLAALWGVIFVAASAAGAAEFVQIADDEPEGISLTYFEPDESAQAFSEDFSEADLADEAETDFASFLQPESVREGDPATPSSAARSPAPSPRRSSGRQSSYRLASVPNMFGDVFFSGGQLAIQFREQGGQLGQAVADVPLGGGSRRIKIGENNSSLPVDRVIFMYNHFHNALEARFPIPGPNARRSLSVDRYTFGFEKTFRDGLWSCQLMLPITGTPTVRSDTPPLTFSADGGDVGNLAIILKRLLWSEDSFAIGGGLGIDAPTGEDTGVDMGPFHMNVENEALHLLPFLGVAASPGERLFFTAFAQVDLATGGNTVTVRGGPLPPTEVGRYTEQNLLYLDVAGGYWLYRNPDAYRWTGLAALAELHYSTTLQDSDALTVPLGFQTVDLRNRLNRFDVVNATAGVQAEIADTTSLRVAGVFPLTDAPERFFDAELQVQLNRRF